MHVPGLSSSVRRSIVDTVLAREVERERDGVAVREPRRRLLCRFGVDVDEEGAGRTSRAECILGGEAAAAAEVAP